MAVMNLEIVASTDDGYGHPSGPTFADTENTCFYGDDGAESVTYLRFLLDADLTGATISAATLTGYMSASGVVLVDVDAVDADDPIAPTTWTILNGFALTTAKVLWTTLSQPAGDQTSPDITTVIQELVDSYTMANGDAFILLIDPRDQTNTTVKEIFSYDQAPTQETARLAITYTVAAAPEVTGTLNGGGSISAAVTKYENQTIRPISTITAAGWDTAPATGQNLHDYASDDSDATWIEDTTA
jgi:hypothetical protein